MSQTQSPFENTPPSGRKLLISTLLAIVLAAVVLVVIVLPAEYGIDPTGLGKAMGLTAMSESDTRTIRIVDNIGGNERVQDVKVPAAGEPAPLPNPNIHQAETQAPQTETIEIVIPPFKETELKVAMQANKVVVYSWKSDKGPVYVDYHGHDPAAADKQFFVRYEEKQSTMGGNGSLVAPFAGEHGWYLMNINDFPITVSITVTGYYDKLVNYGIFGQGG